MKPGSFPQMSKSVLDTPGAAATPDRQTLRFSKREEEENAYAVWLTPGPGFSDGAAARSRITEPSLLLQNMFRWLHPQL